MIASMMGWFGRTRAASAAAVAMLALLLQLLAPLPVSRAEATPICTAAGVIMLLSDDGAPPPEHAGGDHCQLCLLPRADTVPATGSTIPARIVMVLNAGQAPPQLADTHAACFTPYAQRAPPAA